MVVVDGMEGALHSGRISGRISGGSSIRSAGNSIRSASNSVRSAHSDVAARTIPGPDFDGNSSTRNLNRHIDSGSRDDHSGGGGVDSSASLEEAVIDGGNAALDTLPVTTRWEGGVDQDPAIVAPLSSSSFSSPRPTHSPHNEGKGGNESDGTLAGGGGSGSSSVGGVVVVAVGMYPHRN